MGNLRRQADWPPTLDREANRKLAALPPAELAESIVPLVERLSDPVSDLRLGEETACHDLDPDIFHPQGEDSRETMKLSRRAVGICLGCCVMDICLAKAFIRNERMGVWGGTTERKRRNAMPKLKRHLAQREEGVVPVSEPVPATRRDRFELQNGRR
ncbi:WhiB family transcriptional regulator [Candidatus Saccharibacteria bacterium]|nr:WhiB family transcriptional regulator [Candidatus Saccharibacteria bacterium]